MRKIKRTPAMTYRHHKENIALLQQIPALTNDDLKIWAKTLKNNDVLRVAILNEWEIRKIA